MKNKKLVMYVLIIIFILLILYFGIIICKKMLNKKNSILEYIPEGEITDGKMRETLVKLYFLDAQTGELGTEIVEIDSKELMENPYSRIINLLLEGPQEKGLVKLIPENTMLNAVSLEAGTLHVDFSREFIENQNLGPKQEALIVSSIVKTLKELNEIDSIIFLIDGQTNMSFPDGCVQFNEKFT